jgi:P pilus assembly chaperone PapD
MQLANPKQVFQRLRLASLVVPALLATSGISPEFAKAAGMVPQTSVVIVNEADGEATIKVTNTDNTAVLLLVNLENIPEDNQPLLLVTPPVSRVEAGKSQWVRFILRSEGAPLKTQRLKRVTFEGVAQVDPAQKDTARIGVGIRQNLPVIVHPKGLPPEREPWKGLTWRHSNGKLTVSNDTRYVVRLSQQLTLLPMQATAQLPRTYLLAGEQLSVDVPPAAAGAHSVRLYPATVYGFAVDAYDSPLK